MTNEQLIKTMEAVCGRMLRAGWLSGFGHTSEGLALGWTNEGHDVARQLRHVFDGLGPEMNGEELVAFNLIVDTMSKYPRPEDPE